MLSWQKNMFEERENACANYNFQFDMKRVHIQNNTISSKQNI